MAVGTPRNPYQRSAVLTASQGQLIVMLYDGASRFLAQAASAMREGDRELAHNKLRRAETIISHLRASLDFENGGTLSVRLNGLFTFYLRHLNNARVRSSAEPIDEVRTMMGQLRDAWAKIVAENAV
jgi:flagellar protein FliS